ncbi:MAG: hypothetical protein IFJ96_02475, partial [Acidobacteria bacterium]|nr:hypothetical protein [Candidatus Sulfomarinibacter sp. MAG AM2]
MKLLHILKSEPDESVEEILEAFAEDEVTTVRLFEGEVDWAALVDEIFSHD